MRRDAEKVPQQVRTSPSETGPQKDLSHATNSKLMNVVALFFFPMTRPKKSFS
jgi:hypothetical protein